MDHMEELEEMASDCDIQIINDYKFESERIKGLYCDKVIAISKAIKNSKQKACVLAEELGHYYTSSGDIIDLKKAENRKQEYRARMWAYDKQIGLQGIISAFKAKCMNPSDMAEHLEVTEEFLEEALEVYRRKYGIFTKVDNFIIGFEPNLYVIEMFE